MQFNITLKYDQVMVNLAVVGATGAVGAELIRVLEKRNFPVSRLRCFASPSSIGKVVVFQGKEISIEPLSKGVFQGTDIAIFSAGGAISREYVPQAVEEGAFAIDNSSAFRMDPAVPLLIPEINPQALSPSHKIASCPNCSTAIMLMVLGPLHRRFKIRRIAATTYQAASGAGYRAMQELIEETYAFLEGRSYERTVIPHPYAFNLFPHNSTLKECGYVEEELKMREETWKILEDSSIGIHATCVRVPVLRAHSEALNVSFAEEVTVSQAYEILRDAPGVAILEDREKNRFPMPVDASGHEAVFCGRIRKDPTLPHTLDLWAVGDQLLKGAALNAIQIAELLQEKNRCATSL